MTKLDIRIIEKADKSYAISWTGKTGDGLPAELDEAIAIGIKSAIDKYNEQHGKQ